MDTHIEELRKILKYQIEESGGKINPKDDFVGFINDILKWKRKYFPRVVIELPEKKEYDFECMGKADAIVNLEDAKRIGFNQAIDLCQKAVGKTCRR